MADPVAAYRAARTPTEYYAARILVLQRALPEEVLDLAARPVAGRRRLPPAEQRWLDGLAATVRRPGRPVEFRSSSPSPGVRLLEPIGSGGRAGLVALFTGAAGRLNLPLAVILQHLPVAGRELVVLDDPARRAYLDGLPEMAPSLPDLARWLGTYAAGRPLWTLGTSMGGGPAVFAGLLAGAVRASSVGGFDPLTRPGPSGAVEAVRDALVARRDAIATAGTQVLNVFSEGADADVAGAAALATAVGRGRRVVLAGAERHDVLSEAHEGGALDELLELLLGPGSVLPPGDAAIAIRCRPPARDPDDRPGRPLRPGPRPVRRRQHRRWSRLVRTLPRGSRLRRAVVAALYRRGTVAG